MLVAHAERMPSAAPTGNPFMHVWPRLVAAAVVSASRVYQVWCGLLGHDLVYHFEPARLSLHCLNCGHHTPGWVVPARTRGRIGIASTIPHL